ncbi:MAG: hypothetical protein JWQ38_3519 [Flavipsychrobacter sp.]|nr:hypothetical protein [Flavipsychrobacter sp.]
MDPLTAIKQLYDAGIATMREELVFLVQQFHIEPTLQNLPAKSRIKEFEAYMDSDNLPKAVVVQRAIFMKGLINFGLVGRDTEEGWERARQKNEQVTGKLYFNNGDGGDMYREFMKDYSIRKANWIAWSQVWRGMEQDVLSDDQIGYWYYVEEPIRTSTKVVK